MALQLLCGLDSSLFAPSLLSLFPVPSRDREQLESSGVIVRSLNKSPGLSPATLFDCRRVVAELAPAVIHTHRYALHYSLLSSCSSHRLHTIHCIHGKTDGFLSSAGLRLGLSLGIEPVAVSRAAADVVRRLYGVECRLIPNGIDIEKITSVRVHRAQWRIENGVGARSHVFVFVGRIEERKNPLSLLRAFSILNREIQDAELLFAGDGPLMSDLVRAVEDAVFGERVHILGWRDDIPEILAASDTFVLPSLSEACPLSLLEAQAAGLYLVCTDVGGIPEMVKNGIDAVLVRPGCSASLAEAMIGFAKATTETGISRGKAEERVPGKFRLSRMVQAYQELYLRTGDRQGV